SVRTRHSSQLFFAIRIVLIPICPLFSDAGRLCFGLRMSRSRRTTFLPDSAVTPPRFMATNDLPSPETVELMAIVLVVADGLKKSRFVRSVRNASVAIDLGWPTTCSELPLEWCDAGIMPSSGTWCRCSSSWTLVILLLARYRMPIKKMLKTRLNTKPIPIIIGLLGAMGLYEIDADDRILKSGIDPACAISNSDFDCISMR